MTGMSAVAAGGIAACGRARKQPPIGVETVKSWELPAGVAGRGRVFEAWHEHALDSNDQPARRPVEAMLDHLMRGLTGKSRQRDAWETLFRPDDVVGIKPNCRGSTYCSPSAALMDAVIDRLVRVGVRRSNIYVWELGHFADHPLYAHLAKSGVQMKLQDDWGFHPYVYRLSTGESLRFNSAVHRATAIINIGTFKDHGRAGVTGALKNLTFGSIDNPSSHHANSCDPSTAEIYALPILRNKVRLTLADAFRLIYNRGPTGFRSREFNIANNRLYAATDPVAIDRECWESIDTVRKHKGMLPLMKRDDRGTKEGRPHHVLTAARLGLGEADYARIKVHKKKLG